jgi:hypothetical protein
MAEKSGTDWINTFATYLSSALDPVSRTKLKQEYIQWVKARGNYYANLQQTAPEFLELLEVIGKEIAVQVKVEGDAKDTEVDKTPEKDSKETEKEPAKAVDKGSKTKEEPKGEK